MGLTIGLLNHSMNKLADLIQNGGGGKGGKKGSKTTNSKKPTNEWDLNGDGRLQKSEADAWGLNNGGDITVDGNLIDLTGFNESNTEKHKNGTYKYSTTNVFLDLPFETSSTYGGSVFQKVSGQWRMVSQEYHYEYRPNDSLENIFRNIYTFVGYPGNNTVTPYGVMPSSHPNTFKSFMINIRY